ncbi:hypothetical protein OF001_U360028 [Pseudomonas sp. OF001]|nr:hypothetical protein OF001_U360028 [Pseudomonas sp. OF001]
MASITSGYPGGLESPDPDQRSRHAIDFAIPVGVSVPSLNRPAISRWCSSWVEDLPMLNSCIP